MAPRASSTPGTAFFTGNVTGEKAQQEQPAVSVCGSNHPQTISVVQMLRHRSRGKYGMAMELALCGEPGMGSVKVGANQETET